MYSLQAILYNSLSEDKIIPNVRNGPKTNFDENIIS